MKSSSTNPTKPLVLYSLGVYTLTHTFTHTPTHAYIRKMIFARKCQLSGWCTPGLRNKINTKWVVIFIGQIFLLFQERYNFNIPIFVVAVLYVYLKSLLFKIIIETTRSF